MSSLHRRLTLSLWSALVVVGGLSAAFVYLRAERHTATLLDDQLQQVARLAATQVGAATGHVAVPALGRDDDLLITVWDAGGQLRYWMGADFALPPVPAGFSEREIAGEAFRIFGLEANGLHVAVGQETEIRHNIALSTAFAALLPVALLLPLLALLIGLVVRRQLLPLEATVRAITGRAPLALDPVPELPLPDDVRPLIDAVNRLLGQLRDALAHERRFLSDAAHALRTPIAALQLQADVLDGCDDPAERSARLQKLRAGIRRVVRLSQQLLMLAHDAPEPGPPGTTTAADLLLEEATALYGAPAAARGVRIELEPAVDLQVPGELAQLLLVVGNLLENALDHTPVGGLVRLRALADGVDVVVEILDEGPGLPDAELERVFERFYRGAGAPDGGNGLGLATARAVARRLGGRVSLHNRHDRIGIVAVVRFTAPAGQT